MIRSQLSTNWDLSLALKGFLPLVLKQQMLNPYSLGMDLVPAVNLRHEQSLLISLEACLIVPILVLDCCFRGLCTCIPKHAQQANIGGDQKCDRETHGRNNRIYPCQGCLYRFWRSLF